MNNINNNYEINTAKIPKINIYVEFKEDGYYFSQYNVEYD